MPRFTIDIDDKFDQTLQGLKDATGATTKAEVIRRAVASYQYLKNETAAPGNNVSITNAGSIVTNVQLP